MGPSVLAGCGSASNEPRAEAAVSEELRGCLASEQAMSDGDPAAVSSNTEIQPREATSPSYLALVGYRQSLDAATADCEATHPSEGSEGACRPVLSSKPVADCVARQHGLEEGLAPFDSKALFHPQHDRITVTVANTLHEEPGLKSGRLLILDAATGELLDKVRWQTTAR
jgi:hypothetical protein